MAVNKATPTLRRSWTVAFTCLGRAISHIDHMRYTTPQRRQAAQSVLPASVAVVVAPTIVTPAFGVGYDDMP